MERALADSVAPYDCESLLRTIELRTRGLLFDVNVEAVGTKVRVHGYTTSLHVREVAMLVLVVIQGSVAASQIEIAVERNGDAKAGQVSPDKEQLQ